MHFTNQSIRQLLEKYREISRLNKINALLSWDLNVNLPQKATESRSAQIATLTGIITDRWLDTGFRTLLDVAIQQQEHFSSEERAAVRNLEHAGKFYYRVPKDLIVEFSKATTESFMAWQEAKQNDDFASFRPHLEKVVHMNRLIADHLTYKDNRYDALLDLYEPNLTAAKCTPIFDALTSPLRDLITTIQNSAHFREMPRYVGEPYHYPVREQKQLAHFILRTMGYDLKAGRMDVSAHPFTIDLHRADVRITTRYNVHDLRESLMAAIHESGHALYEQGVSPVYDDTPLAGGVSLGIHESQSRFWENQVGRSGQFISFIAPVLRAFFPDQLGDTKIADLVKMINHVVPSVTRVEADEVTYNLHIALRYELENGLINEKIAVDDLPALWREKMKQYLSVEPKTDREGVMQDVHWSYGSFGYFPTYTLGNLYAAQFTRKMRETLPVDELVSRGELGTILSWLRDNIHKHGSLYWPDELVQRVSGESLNPAYLIDYLQKKYTALYEVDVKK